MRHTYHLVAAAALAIACHTASAVVYNVGPSGEHAIESDAVITDVSVNFGSTILFDHIYQPFRSLPNNVGILLAGGGALHATALGEGGGTTFIPTSMTATWSGRADGMTALKNMPGIDFFIFESSSVGGFETLAVGVTGPTALDGFFYRPPSSFDEQAAGVASYAYGYDLDWFGLGPDDFITAIELRNFNVTATVNPVAGFAGQGAFGFVDFDGLTGENILGGPNASPPDGFNSYYFSSEQPFARTDPDPFYVVGAAGATFVSATEVPEPTTPALLGLAGLAMAWRTRRRRA